MGIRRKGRELALQALYQIEITGDASAAAVDLFLSHFEGSAQAKEFARRLVSGVVIRGDTPHFEYVCDAVTHGISKAVWEYRVPISFGVLTTDNVQQAMERAGVKDTNKGYEAALSAIEMVSVLRQLAR